MDHFAKQPPDPEGMPRMSSRPSATGFQWRVDPAFDVPSLLIAVGTAMQAMFSAEEIADLGPRMLISVDLRKGSGIFSIENVKERADA